MAEETLLERVAWSDLDDGDIVVRVSYPGERGGVRPDDKEEYYHPYIITKMNKSSCWLTPCSLKGERYTRPGMTPLGELYKKKDVPRWRAAGLRQTGWITVRPLED